VTQAIDPIGRTFTYSYAGNNIDLEQITETQGSDDYQIGSWTYNSQHRPLTYTDGSGQETQYSYNSSGQLITLTDANSNVTTLTYTGTCPATIGGSKTTGDVLSITVHDAGLTGGQKTDSYTVLSGDTLSTIASGLVAAINGDTSLQAIGVSASASGTAITLTSTSVNVTTYTESTSGGSTETISLGTNTFGYLTKIDGPLSGSDDVTTFSYDAYGRLAERTDSEGYTLSFLYDNANRLTQTTFPDSTTEQTVYDKLDAVLRKDRIGRWTQDSFDSMDQIAFEIDPLGRKTQYTWCACGSLAALTDPAGNTTTWNHDLQGRPISKTYPDGTSVSYAYEVDSSRLRSKTDALGQTTYYTYNADSTPFQVSYQNAVNPTATVTYVFDPNFNRISSVQKNDWGTLSYSYNPYIMPMGSPTTGGGMLEEVQNNVIPNSAITYSFDVLGRTTNRSINGASNSINWSYDAMSRITSEQNALGTFNYAYVDDVSGSSKGTLRLASISYPNSQVTNFGWYGNTGDQRLQQIVNLSPSGNVMSRFAYLYDSAGEITQWEQRQGPFSNLFWNLGYDAAGQLTSAQAGYSSPAPPYAPELYYGYDLASNRTSVQSSSMQKVIIGGTKTTGDVLTVAVKNPLLSGGQESVSYTVLSGDTLSTITTGLAAAISADSNLQAIGTSASTVSSGALTLLIHSVSSQISAYSASLSSGATETIATDQGYVTGAELADIGGAKTTGDVLTITVHSASLSGGEESVSYTVLSTDTLTSIATGLKNAINADTHLSGIGLTATSAGPVVAISSLVYFYTSSVSSGATETITLTANQNPTTYAIIDGTKTTGDVLTITCFDPALPGGHDAISYTVASADTITTITTGLASAINADSNLSSAGITATSNANAVTISSKSPNLTTYRQSLNSTATESISFTGLANNYYAATVGGTPHTGDVLTITAYDSYLSGGQKSDSYTVRSTDTLATIASGLTSAINADSTLSSFGISATSSSTVIWLHWPTNKPDSFSTSVSSGATETLTVSPTVGAVQAAYNNVNELVSLTPGGSTFFQGTTDKPVKSSTITSQVIPVTATIQSALPSFTSSIAGTPTETLSMAPDPTFVTSAMTWVFTVGGSTTAGDTINLTTYDTRLAQGQETDSYVVQPGDTLTTIASNLAQNIANDSNLSSIGIHPGSSGAQFWIEDNSNTQAPSNAFTWTITSLGTETVTLGVGTDQNTSATIAGTVTTGDIVSLTVDDSALVNGPETVSYTVASGNTTTSIATGLASAINADAKLQAVGVGARSSGAVVTVGPYTYYSTSVTGSATETLTLGTTTRGSVPITISGSPTTGDVVKLTANNPLLSGGSETASYTVLSTDSMVSIAAGLSAAINADSNLQTLGVTVPPQSTLAFSQSLSGSAQLPQGASLAQINGVDGGSNSKTNVAAMAVSSGSSVSFSQDADGQMTSDGTNSYAWDAEGRLIKITYPGSGNFSTFVYDGLGRNVMIQEYVSSSLTSTKQFIWCGNERCEQRNASSTITAQFFSLGETISGTSYFYSVEGPGVKMQAVRPSAQLALLGRHLRAFNPVSVGGSVREMTNSSGTIEAQYGYDPYGRPTLLQGSLASDRQFAGYYFHAPSELCLTRTRAYSAGLGRWINRDPIGARGGNNLYRYVANNPVSYFDPSGTTCCPSVSGNPKQSTDQCFACCNIRFNICMARCLSWGFSFEYCVVICGLSRDLCFEECIIDPDSCKEPPDDCNP
jgi:RHS repeat-associated protein